MFIGYVRDNLIQTYEDKSLRDEVSAYLDDLMETVAVPKLVDALKSKDAATRLEMAQRLEELSRKNTEMIKFALDFLKDLTNDPNKDVASVVQKIVSNYDRAQKRKVYNEKRRKMRDLDNKLASGKISDAEYLKQRKEFLQLGQEVGEED